MPKLNKEEREILEAYEGGKLKSVANVKEELQRYQAYAAATNSQDKRMNVRLSSKDLNALQARALREGIPHQTLASSILHKYVEGQLVDAAKAPTKQIRAAK